MATRRERVVLELEDHFSAQMARDAAAVALFARELDNVNGRADRSSRSTDKLDRSVSNLRGDASKAGAELDRLGNRTDNMGRSTENGAKQIDRLSGRLTIFAQAAAALGPALVPLSAAAVPALAGVATQLGFATLAAGAAVVAFQGVGTALKALDTYQAAPTAAHMDALRIALDKLGPAGQEFVLALDKLEPRLQHVQNIAQQGLFPGVTDSLHELLQLTPQVDQVVFTLTTSLGDLAREGAQNLTSGKFADFFDYLNTTARPILTQTGETLGHFIAGIANVVVAFDPLSRDFASGMLSMSAAFEQWTAGLAQTQGFQDFVSYVEKSGPQALDALGAIGTALLGIVEAAAPVGSVVLPVVTDLAKAFSALVNSPVGPTLVATAAAVSVLSRSMSLLGVSKKALAEGTGLAGTGLVKRLGLDPASIRGAIAATRELAAAQRDLQAAQLGSAVTSGVGGSAAYVAAQERVAKASERVQTAERAKSAALRESAAGFGKAAALAGGLALASSGLADKTGLANTASLALMGTIAGPEGAALGAAIGLTLDYAHANDDLEASLSQLNRVMSSSVVNFTDQQSAIDQATQSTGDMAAKAAGFEAAAQHLLGPFSVLGDAIGKKFAGDADKGSAAVQKARVDMMQMGQTVGEVYAQLNHGDTSMIGAPLDELMKVADKVTPALQRAGISAKAFFHSAAGSELRKQGVAAIRDYFSALNSAGGKSKAVGEALKGLESQMTDTGTAADALKTAMDTLFGVELSQSAATDAWTQGLRDLRRAIAGTNGAILGNSKAALSNRDAIRTSVQQLEDKVNADAAAGVSGRKLVDSLIAGRKAIIQQGVAAGASRKDMAAYLHTLGLTPKNLVTIIKADGALTEKQKVEALGRAYGLTPKEVRTLMSQPGMARSKADIDALAHKYNLTPKEVRTLLQAIDQASGKISAVQAEINRLNGTHATTWIYTQHVAVWRTVGNPSLNKPRGVSAAGNIYAYAAGDVANAHQPVIERMPTYRMWAEPETKGEAYIPLADDWRRPRAVAIWEETGHLLGQYAQGGIAAFASGGVSRRDKAIHELTGEIGKLTDELKKARDDRRQYKQTVSQAFISDPFGGTLGGFEGQLRYEAGRLRGTKADLATLRAKGIAPSLLQGLAASGNSALIDQFAHLSKSQLAAEARALQVRNTLDRQVGTSAAEGVYRKQIVDLTHEVAHLSRELQALRHGKHIGNTNFNGRVTIRDSESKAKTKRAAQKVRHG